MIILFILLFRTGSQLIVPLNGVQQRCMIAFTYGQHSTIKLEINFPQIPGRLEDQLYEIVYRDTDSKQAFHDTIIEGLYRRELEAQANVIYEVCFSLHSERDLGIMKVEYQAFAEMHVQLEQVVLPDSIAKSDDLKKTYHNLMKIQSISDQFINQQRIRNKDEEVIFGETRDLQKSLVKLSIIELLVIVLAGGYQVLALRKFILDNRIV